MKINRITYSYNVTVQMRQFEPVVVSGFCEAQVDPSDKPETVYRKIKELVNDQVDMEVNKHKRYRKESYEDEQGTEKTQ